MSINVIGSHLAEHCPTLTKAEGMRQRLALVNEKWDNVCEQATLWQTRLQTALLEVSTRGHESKQPSNDIAQNKSTCQFSEWRVSPDYLGATAVA